MEAKYTSRIYNAQKAFVLYFIIYLSLMMVVFIVYKLMPDLIPAWVIFAYMIGLIICSNLFLKRIKESFTQNVIISLNDQSIIVDEYSSKTNEIKKSYKYLWEDINSYRFYLTGKDTTHIVIYSNNFEKKDFAFKDDRDREDAINDEKSLLRLFITFVRNYNYLNSNRKIFPCLGFMNTKNGNILLWCIGLLNIIAFIIHFEFKPKSSYIWIFIGFIMIAKLITSKNEDIKIYNKLIDMS